MLKIICFLSLTLCTSLLCNPILANTADTANINTKDDSSITTSSTNRKTTNELDDYTKLIIESPNLNVKCRHLLTERENILQKKHKLQKLELNNDHLLVVLPFTKRKMRQRLLHLKKRIKLELGLYKLKIANKEETIIKKGCPGLVL